MMVETMNEGKNKFVKDQNISDKKLKEVDQAVKETALDGGKSWNALSKEKKIKFLNILKKMAE